MIEVATLFIRTETAGVSQAGTALQGLEQQAHRTEQATNKVGTSMLTLDGIAKRLATAVAAISFANHAKDAALLAARFETLGIVMSVAGANAGYTFNQMEQLDKSLRTTGISFVESRQQLSRMAAAQLDMGKATDIARAAQNLAVVAQTDSSDAFDRMLHGIVTGNPLILKTMGLMVSFQEAYKRAGKELSEHEKLILRQNIVLEKAAMYNGIYEASMMTASKQLGTMTRYISDFSVLVGSFTLEALTRAVFSVAGGFKEVNARLVEMMDSGEIARWANEIANGLTAAAKGALVAAESFALFWTASKVSTGITATVAAMQGLTTAVTAAGGAWMFLRQEMLAAAGTLTTVAGALSAIAALASGILIGKYLVENFRWAADASLTMAESILNGITHVSFAFQALGVAAKTIFSNAFDFIKEGWASTVQWMAESAQHLPGMEVAASSMLAHANATRASKGNLDMSEERERLKFQLELELNMRKISYDRARSQLDSKFTTPENDVNKRLQELLAKIKPVPISDATGGKGASAEKIFSTTESITAELEKLTDVSTEGDARIAALTKKYNQYAHVLGATNPLVREFADVLAYANEHMGYTPNQVAKAERAIKEETEAIKLRTQAMKDSTDEDGHVDQAKLSMKIALINAEREYTKDVLLGVDERIAAMKREAAVAEAHQQGKQQNDQIQQQFLGSAAGVLKHRSDLQEKMLEQEMKVLRRNVADKTLLDEYEAQKRLNISRKGFDGMRRAYQEWNDSATNMAQQFGDMFTGVMDSTTEAIVQFTMTGKLSVSSMVNSMLTDLARLAARQMTSSLFGGLLSAVGGGLSGMFSGGLGGGAAVGAEQLSTGAIVNPSGVVFGMHSGGVVGLHSTFSRQVPMDIFESAPRYHGGGPVLQAGEVPIIAQAGEEVSSRGAVASALESQKDVAAGLAQLASSMKSNGTRIVNVVDPTLVHEAMSSSAGESVILNQIKSNRGLIKQILGSGSK